MTPEQKARQQIDAMLVASGWVVQDYKAVDFSAGRGIALREVPLTPSRLARAFAGQLVPQDPTDEPAEKLLERLKRAPK